MKINISLFTCLLCILVAPVAHGQSEIYDRYAERDDLAVYYVENFRTDSIQGTFIILEAHDTATWFALAKEFGVGRGFTTKGSNDKNKYIISFQNSKDPTQDPPMITLPSGDQEYDISQSCLTVVDITNQRIFMIFAENEVRMNIIEHKITDNLIRNFNNQ